MSSDLGQGGADLGQLQGLTVPVRVSGAFERLSYKMEWGALLEDATRARLEQKKTELKARAEDALKDQARDAHKGLFGR